MSVQIENLVNPEILLEINNAAVPDVNRLDLPKAQWLLTHAALSRIATVEGQVAGVIVVLSELAEYDSSYFRWFTERYRNFIYIDRVIVPVWARRLGVAAELYRHVEQVAGEKGLAISVEVYSEPPNTASLKFHAKMSFQEVGCQFSELEKKTVSKLMKYPDRAQRKVG
jgi:uncharacterized protein